MTHDQNEPSIRALLIKQIQDQQAWTSQSRASIYRAALSAIGKFQADRQPVLREKLTAAISEIEETFARYEGDLDEKRSEVEAEQVSQNRKDQTNDPAHPELADITPAESAFGSGFVDRIRDSKGPAVLGAVLAGIAILLAVGAYFLFSNSGSQGRAGISQGANSATSTPSTNSLIPIVEIEFVRDLENIKVQDPAIDEVVSSPAVSQGGLKLSGKRNVWHPAPIRIEEDASYFAQVKFRIRKPIAKPDHFPGLNVGTQNLDAEYKALAKGSNFSWFVHEGRLNNRRLNPDTDGTISLTGVVLSGDAGEDASFPAGTVFVRPWIHFNDFGNNGEVELVSYTIQKLG